MASSRLLVTLEAAEDSLALLEGYSRLAAALQRELVGVLVADPALRHAAALPFTRIQSLRSGMAAQLDPASTDRALRVFARRVEARLAETCGRLQVRWSLQLAEGTLAASALAEGDVLALGPRLPPAEAAPAAACPVLLMRRSGRSLVVVYEGGRATLELARAVAERERLPLSVVAVARTRPKAARLAEEARTVLAGLGSPDVETQGLIDRDGGGLPALVAAREPRAVVLDACRTEARLPELVAALAAAGR